MVPPTAQIKTEQQQADADSKATKDDSKFIQMFLLGFGFIAVGVGAFVIFNTLSITLAQRVRELATLRTLGASRRQVKRSVLTEGLAMGLFASVVGLVLGLALAKGLNGLFQAFGIDLPHSSTVIQTRTVIVALVLGVGVTLIASLSPARRATRIPPVTALRSPPDSRITGALSPVITDSSIVAIPSMTSPSPGIRSPASAITTSPARSCDAETRSIPEPTRRFATASVFVLRRLSACALPRASAIASAKFAKSTMNQSQSAS